MRNLLPFALLGAVLLAGCSRTEPAPDPVRAVRTLTVSSQTAGGSFEYAGEVRARTESRLGFRVGGKILKRAAELGETVKAGQVLAQLDPQDLRLGQDAARASVAMAQASFDQNAADFKRYTDLSDQGFIGGAELERREAALKTARAQLDQARAQFNVQGNQAGYATLLADAGGQVIGIRGDHLGIGRMSRCQPLGRTFSVAIGGAWLQWVRRPVISFGHALQARWLRPIHCTA